MWYANTMEYHPTIKRNEIVPFEETQMDPEIIIYSEAHQREKNKYCVLMHICGI